MSMRIVENTTPFKTIIINEKEKQIPVDWDVRKISSFCQGKGTLFKDGDWIEKHNLSEDGIRYLTSGNIGVGVYKEQGKGYISEETFKTLNCMEIYAGDLVFSRLNSPQGRCCIIPELNNRIITAVDNVVFRPESQQNKIFLKFVFSSSAYLKACSIMATGTTMKRISRKNLGNIEVYIPATREEQDRIATYLSGIEGKLNLASRVVELMETKLRYYTRELTSGTLRITPDNKLVPNANWKTVIINEKEKQVPEDWDVSNFTDVFNLINGSAYNEKTWSKNGHKIVRIQNLNGSEKYNHYDGDLSKKVVLEKGDILFSWSGTIGLYKWNKNGKYVLNQHIFKVENKKITTKEYTYYSLVSIMNHIRNNTHGLTMKHITKERLYQIKCIIPPSSEEQDRIATYLSGIETQLEVAKKMVEKYEDELKWSSQALLSGKYVLQED